MGRRGYYGGRVGCAVPPGWVAKIDRLADEQGVSRSEWVRALLRRTLEADRKRRARAAKSGGGQ